MSKFSDTAESHLVGSQRDIESASVYALLDIASALREYTATAFEVEEEEQTDQEREAQEVSSY